MKAQDLRIGNYVVIMHNVQKVTQILEKGLNCGNVGCLYSLVEPIPLTEEWLERFGFEKTYSELTYKEYDFNKLGVEISSDITTVSYNYGSNVEWVNFTHIKYVHQLQNLYFAITGEELTVKEPA